MLYQSFAFLVGPREEWKRQIHTRTRIKEGVFLLEFYVKKENKKHKSESCRGLLTCLFR